LTIADGRLKTTVVEERLMGGSAHPTVPRVEVMSAVPAPLRGRIVSGMRWTLWLSVVAVPFSYGTSVLLARTGPDVIGTYGLLMVYIGVASSLFYLGGDAVVVKFVPELEPAKRFPFLVSYFLVIVVALVPWMGATLLWPGKLHYIFGDRGGPGFYLLVLFLSPLYIMFLLIVAALKAVLDMRWAQTLLRLVTIGSFAVYATLFFRFREVLQAHAGGLIWGVFLGLAGIASVLGLLRLLRLEGWRTEGRSFGFFLPRDFWRYTLSTQQVSAVGFFLQRLDLILVLNFGGLAVLGKYVAILSLAEALRTANRFFADTLLPSLTNAIASRDLEAASQIFGTNLRILFLVNLAATSGLALLAAPLMRLFGPRYTSLRPLLILIVLGAGLAAPGGIGGTLLTSMGKQQRSFWVSIGQLGLFLVLFFTLWPRYQLLGAVLASGLSQVVSYGVLLAAAKYGTPVRFSAGKDYIKFALATIASAGVALAWPSISVIPAVAVWVAAVGLFLVAAHYQLAECQQLVRCFLPVGWPLARTSRDGCAT